MTAESGLPGLVGQLPELEASLRVDPSARNVVRVAEAFRFAGDSGHAVELLRPVVTREPSLISPRVLLSWCLADLGLVEESRTTMASVRSLDPGNPYARAAEPELPVPSTFVKRAELPGSGAWPPPLEVGTAAETEAEPERPLTEQELREVPPSPLYSATLAEIFERQGFEGKALEILEEVVRLHPERGDLRERIVDLKAREAEGAS